MTLNLCNKGQLRFTTNKKAVGMTKNGRKITTGIDIKVATRDATRDIVQATTYSIGYAP